MFFCEKCRIKNKWPTSMGGSHGRCEVCGKVANCHDVRSSNLPLPEPEPEPPIEPVRGTVENDFGRCYSSHNITFTVMEVTVAGPRFAVVNGHRRYTSLSKEMKEIVFDDLLSQWRIYAAKERS